jgi:hypothetical protein
MKMLVCGGREYADTQAVFAALDAVNAKKPIMFIICGGAKGADEQAVTWAKARNVHYAVVPALWTTRGTVAGPNRNDAMLEFCQPDGVTAFPGGSGTAHMVKRAKECGLIVWEPYGAKPAPKPQPAPVNPLAQIVKEHDAGAAMSSTTKLRKARGVPCTEHSWTEPTIWQGQKIDNGVCVKCGITNEL